MCVILYVAKNRKSWTPLEDFRFKIFGDGLFKPDYTTGL